MQWTGGITAAESAACMQSSPMYLIYSSHLRMSCMTQHDVYGLGDDSELRNTNLQIKNSVMDVRNA